jgi:mannose-1-phosphate guanylyltransferase
MGSRRPLLAGENPERQADPAGAAAGESTAPPRPVYGVILAGGRGVRLWPLSRESRGKQFLPLAGETSLIRQAAERLLPLTGWGRILVVTEGDGAQATARELPELPPGAVMVEPMRRNTAPAIALAAYALARRDPDAVMVVSPADHAVTDPGALVNVLRAAVEAAEPGALVTLGMTPTRPETGYGYIEKGDVVGEHHGVAVHRARSFVEKPDRARAERLVAGRLHLWNSGIFVWRVDAITQAFERHLPALHAAFAGLEDAAFSTAAGETRRAVYQAIPSVSIDYGVMEKARNVVVVPGSFGWNDLGSWRSLDDIWPADEHGQRVRGELVAQGSRGVTLLGGKRVVAVVGLDDVVIVETEDALLVCRKEHAQDVREVVQELERRGRRDLL